MKKREWIISIVILLAVIIAGLWIWTLHGGISRSIEKANYCTVDDDCTIAYYGCPFGCGRAINKNEEMSLELRIGFARVLHPTYFGCVYKCLMPADLECEQGKCVEKICEIGVEYERDITGQIPCRCPQGYGTNYTENSINCYLARGE